jgi:2,3-bisphosphoglycerate-independent phosphoglycerate mutase
MKYVVIIGDGMADFPIEDLGGKTPLQASEKPYMDMMARKGFCGNVITIPEGMSPGSDVAGMSIFGYNPARYYTGRAPIEAAGMGIGMEAPDVAFRCNLVHLDSRSEETIMADYSGGHITTEEARILIESLGQALGGERFRFYPGVSYRHIMVWKEGLWEMGSTPPHDITGQEIGPHLPRGAGAEQVIALMEEARTVLADHPVNRKRRDEGKLPANAIWLWGQGKKAGLPSFAEKYGLKGATVAAVDLIKGISALIGFDAPFVKGATGYLDTDYSAKAAKALDLLGDYDIVYIHVEAPDEASHNGNLKEKLKAIESVDRLVVGRIYEEAGDRAKILVTTDHATPISMKTHYACPVPFIIFDKETEVRGPAQGYSEGAGETTMNGEEMITRFLRRQTI